MRNTSLLACLATGALFGTPLSAQDAPAPVVILKMDDMAPGGAPPGKAVPARWQRLIDFLEARKIRASIGVMGFSLEDDNATYFAFLKDLDRKGFELWNHGYKQRKAEDKGEFEEGTAETQKASLEKTQRLAKEKLGIVLRAFGPHWSGTNADTEAAISQVPDLKLWFYGPANSKVAGTFMFERTVNLENPTFVPDFEKFKAAYEKVGARRKYLALQGHPNQWTDERWAGFEKVMDYLAERKCPFMTALEYHRTLGKP